MVSYTANGRRATRSPARSRTTSGSSATGRCAERRAGRRWPGATRRRFFALQDRMDGNDRAVLENEDLLGQALDLDDAPSGHRARNRGCRRR